MNENTWLWVGCIGMAVGSVVLVAQMGRRTTGEEAHGVIHSVVTMIAAGLYLLMALGQGSVVIDHGREFLWGRYLDWSFTTPLLLVGLALTAMEDLRRRIGIVVALLAADLYMIFAGFEAALSPTSSADKWIWFLMSCGAFLGVFWIMWGPLRAEATRAGNGRDYLRDAAVLSVLWLIYPVVFLLGTEGLLIISPALGALGYTVLDLLSKVAYGVMSTAETNAKFGREAPLARELPQS